MQTIKKSQAITITLTDEQFAEFEKLRNGFTPPMKKTELVVWLLRQARLGFQQPGKVS